MNGKPCATSHKAQAWSEIDFMAAKCYVKKLQMRIAKAAKEGRYGKVKSLQWLLTHSYSAKALAVKRVTENQGKRTSGVDHELWDIPSAKVRAVSKLNRRGYHPKPLRRIYIPKKNGKMRPLSIPTMTDRAMQTLHKLALEPVAESTADLDSYGFRPYRCVQDAIEHCFACLARKTSPEWILEGDIKGCFDNLDHDWILNNIPMDKTILRKFLRSGYVEAGKLNPTKAGTPQGGTISPVICNMALDGLELLLKKLFKRQWKDGRMYNPKVSLARYADDFIITGESRELLEREVLPLVRNFMTERGLALSEDKTVITHIDDGFDFLGCNIRKYRGKLLTKPSKENVYRFLSKVRGVIQQHKASTQEELIRVLNPIIRGWVNFQRFNVSAKTFRYVDTQIFQALWRWAKRRHHNKGMKWIAKRYFHFVGTRKWTFSAVQKYKDGGKEYFSLEYAEDTKIARFPRIRTEANPYDQGWQIYFEERETEKMRLSLKGHRYLIGLFNRQKGCCAICGDKLTLETGGRCHKYWNHGASFNLLVHPNCHKELHLNPDFTNLLQAGSLRQ